MKALLFADDLALQTALSTGLIPGELASSPVSFRRELDGRVYLQPAKPLERRVLQTLASVGVKPATHEGGLELLAECWAQVLLPRPGVTEPPRGPILFVAPPSAPALELAAELLRLGCDRQDFRFGLEGTDPTLVRAVDPPYYTLASVLDGARPLRAFAPSPPGQEQVWTEIGFTHPLAGTLRSPDGQLLLLSRDGSWTRMADGPWRNLYEVLELQVPGEPTRLEARAPTTRMQVPLRLARASRNEPAGLWVLRERAVEQMDLLLGGASEETVARLLFAVAGPPENPTIILRARAGRQGPPLLELKGESYVPLIEASLLYIPHDATIEPPLRREKLRALLVGQSEDITWLAPTVNDGFRLERIAESAFSPLADWVEYLVHRAPVLETWVRNATFDFAAFESTGGEWSDAPARAPAAPEARSRRGHHHESSSQPPPVAEPAAVAASAPRTPARVEEYRLAPTAKEEQALRALEGRFLELEVPADDPARSELWQQMAQLQTRIRNGRDAGLCWTRALWELPPGDALEVCESWAAAEAHLLGRAGAASLVPQLLDVATPTRDETRALAAQVVWAAHRPGKVVAELDTHRIQVWLDHNDDNLDVRSLWLARLSLARLVGGDALGLARTRDRLLAKLHRGLSLERDIPTFLRFLGHSGGRSGPSAQRLLRVLEDLLQRFEKTERKRSAVEAPRALTHAYGQLIFAYGLARLGAADRARELRSLAQGQLDAREPVHGFLVRAFGARIDLAIDGLPTETPMPAPIQGELNSLEKFLRYKVDRLRQASSILEPQERLDPIQGFQRGGADPRGEELASLRGINDPGLVAAAVNRLMKRALDRATPADDRARLLDGLMDFFPVLPEAQAMRQLSVLLGGVEDVPPLPRLQLLEEALMLGGYFGNGDLVRQVVGRIEAVLGAIDAASAAEAAAYIGRCLRSLRRVGLRDEAAHLLEVASSLVRGDTPRELVARLNIAAGFAYLGNLGRAEPEFEKAHRALRARDLAMADRLTLTRATAQAYSQTPQELAATGIMRLAEQLPSITDSFNTNSHFCLSVVHFIESLVQGLASDDLALGEFGRRWLEEEEYLVRRRVQREHAEAGSWQRGRTP